MNIPGKSILAAFSLILLSSCGPTPQLRVDDAVVKLSPVTTNPSALYFTVHGGPADLKLLSVTSRSAIRTEMHESGKDPKTGMMTMTPIRTVPVPADATVKFAPGGKHVMVWGINLPARRLNELETEFLFSNGDRILVEVPIQPMGGTDAEHKGH